MIRDTVAAPSLWNLFQSLHEERNRFPKNLCKPSLPNYGFHQTRVRVRVISGDDAFVAYSASLPPAPLPKGEGRQRYGIFMRRFFTKNASCPGSRRFFSKSGLPHAVAERGRECGSGWGCRRPVALHSGGELEAVAGHDRRSSRVGRAYNASGG